MVRKQRAGLIEPYCTDIRRKISSKLRTLSSKMSCLIRYLACLIERTLPSLPYETRSIYYIRSVEVLRLLVSVGRILLKKVLSCRRVRGRRLRDHLEISKVVLDSPDKMAL